MKIAVVLPRMGDKALGGAEIQGAAYARGLSDAGHDVEILTTCALDLRSWENELAEGESTWNSIPVRRFRVEPGDRDRFDQVERRIQRRMPVGRDDELAWIECKGNAPGLYEYLHSADHDRVLVTPYSSATTYFSVLAVPGKAVLQPLLHDEPYARLAVAAEIIGAARSVLFDSPPEAALARRLFGELPPHALGGMCLDPPECPSDPDGFRRANQLGRGPLLLYAGRWEAGKGVPRLCGYVRAARRRHKKWCLALIGGGPDLPRRLGRGVVPVGFVSESEKNAAFASADVFCQPSKFESFSIVMMEAWMAGTPVLVNGACAVTRYHCRRSGGGLWFTSFPEFEAATEILIENPHKAVSMANSGRKYALDLYSRDAVIERVQRLLEV